MLRVRPISLNRLFHGIHAPAIGVMPSNPRTRLRHPASSRAEPLFRRSEGSPQYTHPTRVFAQYSIEAPHPHRVRRHPERSRSSGGERDLPTHIKVGAFALYPIQSPRPPSSRAEPLFRRREGSPISTAPCSSVTDSSSLRALHNRHAPNKTLLRLHHDEQSKIRSSVCRNHG